MKSKELSTADSLIYLLKSKIPTLPASPINIQHYAQNILNTYNEDAVWFANATILAESNINIFSVNLTNSWPFEFARTQVIQFVDTGIEQDFGLITPLNQTNMVRLTTNITFYLDSDLLMIFFLDDGGAQLSNYLGPGLINNLSASYMRDKIPGSWSKTN